MSQDRIEGAYQRLTDHEQAEAHEEHDAAIAVVAELMDCEPFQQMWVRLSVEDRDDITTTIADKIEQRLDANNRRVLARLASQI